jgi:GH24 family phage-related lysozyme (muramidase)
MHISDEGFDLIKHFEGCELEAYKCAAGVWTMGMVILKMCKKAMSGIKKKQIFMLWA